MVVPTTKSFLDWRSLWYWSIYCIIVTIIIIVQTCTGSPSLATIEVLTNNYDVLKTAKPGNSIYFRTSIPVAIEAQVGKLPNRFALYLAGADVDAHWRKMGGLLRKPVIENGAYVYESEHRGKVPYFVGLHHLQWYAAASVAGNAILNLTVTVEVSCSDGNMCNGYERLVSIPQGRKMYYKCAAPSNSLCDDKSPCTNQECAAETGMCTYALVDKQPAGVKGPCASCTQGYCEADCADTQNTCGFDGCFGYCGPQCPTGKLCSSGQCVPDDDRLGTCTHPISLNEEAKAVNYDGKIIQYLDFTNALDVITPKCDAFSDFPEMIFRLDAPRTGKFVGLDVRVLGLFGFGGKTTVTIIEPDITQDAGIQGCLKSSVKPETVWACVSEFDPFTDSQPRWTSPATWMMRPGRTYYIAIERGQPPSDDMQPVKNLTVQFYLTPECTTHCPPDAECGDSGCAGVTCGDCDAGKQCYNGKCLACTPSCPSMNSSAACGQSDGCGGTCVCMGLHGNDLKNLELQSYSVISSFALASASKQIMTCNHLLPKCTHLDRGIVRSGCAKKNEFCSSECKCIPLKTKLPDLTILPFYPHVDEVYISEDSCALDEKCVGGPGSRTVIKFDTRVFNQGLADFRLPGPPPTRPDLFEWATCHGHYHLKDFLSYTLLSENGTLVRLGEKRSFCVMDMDQIYPRPDAPCEAYYNCNNQGLSIGWADTYEESLDCQFIDITNIRPGDYIVKQCVNLNRYFEEMSYENNCVTAKIHIGPSASPTTASPTPPTPFTPSQCRPDCPNSWISDGFCDPECDNADCNYDGGDCTGVPCNEGCPKGWLGDGFCDFNCNVQACNFDNGDCQGNSG